MKEESFMFIQPSKEFRRRSRPFFWGAILILSAIVLILEGLGISLGKGMDWWRIILGVVLVACLIYVILFRHFADIFIPLALLFLVFEYPLALLIKKEDGKIIPWWFVIIAAVLLTVGFYVISKPTHFLFFSKKTEKKDSGSGSDSIGSKLLYLEADKLDGTAVRDHLGFVELYINNKKKYTSGAVVTFSDNMGKILIHIPDEWDVITQANDNLGKIDVPPHTGTGEKNITLAIHDNLGSITVVFDDSEKV